MVGGAQAQGSEALTSETRVAGALTWKAQGSAKLMFSDAALYGLLIPIIVEQFLNALMGMADTMMISNLGSAAISAVSLTDSINTLMIQVFAALAAGGTVICSQYLGQKNLAQCNKAARQLLLIILVLSGGIAAFCFALRRPLLALIFGQVSGDVMAASLVYFEITVLSYPFFALFQGGAGLFRASGDSKLPMRISILTNLMNIVGNAVLIFVIPMGVAGAALSTLLSRVVGAVWILACLHRDRQKIVVRNYLAVRPDGDMIKKILFLSIPAGVENGMFQFGKLAIQSSVSTLGTTAIAAQAMTSILENVNGIAGCGVGIGMMTVVGQCLGAGHRVVHDRVCDRGAGGQAGRDGAGCGRAVPEDGAADHDREADFLGDEFHTGVRIQGGGRCQVYDARLFAHDVAVPGGGLDLHDPGAASGNLVSVDRHVYGLGRARDHIQDSLY